MKRNKWLKAAFSALLAVLLLVGGYVAYLFIDYHRLEDMLPLEIVKSGKADAGEVQRGAEYRVVSANLGFGAYSADYSFFMDGGKESRARSLAAAITNIICGAEPVFSADPDFILFQEIDVDSTRSHHLDEAALLRELAEESAAGKAVYSAFAQNYDSSYLFYPFTEPHGASRSGLLTFSRYPMTSALRRSLPVESGVMKFLDLDRCYSVQRLAVKDGGELVLYNLHLSAYTSDGTIATEQLELLCADMLAEYEKGNWCVAGGDFNKDLLGNSGEIFGVPASEKDTWAQPIPEGTIPEGIRLIAPAGAASCRAASEPYNENTSFRLTVDGFMVSDNVSVAMSEVIDTVFAHSDHNPVEMIFTLN
ncbi:MAG: endonuclease/exonuclease/phosphatase family protein [Oscillospiraceae bacterium]|nr:endonuclease/exonuclease/phosphatase family protein [Oscillospiraceae bacterium]